MTIRDQYRCKRLALGMTQKEFAAIAEVDEGNISLFENGEWVTPIVFEKIKYNVENYIRSLKREKYLTTRMIEELLTYQIEDESEHPRTLGHLMVHISKLNMMYVGDKEF